MILYSEAAVRRINGYGRDNSPMENEEQIDRIVEVLVEAGELLSRVIDAPAGTIAVFDLRP